tara:strand:+ start:352 stop:477 length:126 start_codon:yes stop_codon:yes gene_type:complete
MTTLVLVLRETKEVVVLDISMVMMRKTMKPLPTGQSLESLA